MPNDSSAIERHDTALDNAAPKHASLLASTYTAAQICGSCLQVRTTKTVFAAWMQAAESSSLQREEVEWQVSKRANARHVSMAFIGWCRLHTVCKQDAQRIGLCRRCAPLNSDMFPTTDDAIMRPMGLTVMVTAILILLLITVVTVIGKLR